MANIECMQVTVTAFDPVDGLARGLNTWPEGVERIRVWYTPKNNNVPRGRMVSQADWDFRRFELGLPNSREEEVRSEHWKALRDFLNRSRVAHPTPCQEARDGAEAVGDFVDALHTPEHPYYLLAQALFGAYRQSAHGKGKERHANDLPFNEQPMQAISDLIGSGDGMAYQVVKKVQESLRMDRDAAIRELHGAIVYAAGMIVRLQAEDSTD